MIPPLLAAQGPGLDQFVAYALTVSPLVLVQVGGAIWALVALGRRSNPMPAVLTLVALALTLLGLIGRAILLMATTSGNYEPGQIMRAHQVYGVVSVGLETIAMIFLIVAALGWRSAPTASPR